MWRERRLWDAAIDLSEKTVTSVYFGGGTPTVLPVRVLREVLKKGKDVNLAQGAGVTCEASPGTLSREKTRLLGRETTRISLGVQSFDDELLAFMNRDHNADGAERAIRLAMANSPHVNVDLIYGFPTQSFQQWIATLERICEISPQSITVYRYWRKHGSAWFKEQFDFAHEMLARLMYFTALEALERAGYSLGPLHWFLKGTSNNEYTSRWGEGVPNIGFGVAGYGSSRNFVFRKTSRASEYAEAIAKRLIPFQHALVFNEAMQQASELIGQLRAFHKTTLAQVSNAAILATIREWVGQSLAEKRGDKLFLTEGGKALFDWMEKELLKRFQCE